MPNRWETSNGLNAHRADARSDADHDGLRNLGEFRRGTTPTDEDSDNDGDDDGDEDGDHDGTDNEDEDDSNESCVADDDDSDED